MSSVLEYTLQCLKSFGIDVEDLEAFVKGFLITHGIYGMPIEVCEKYVYPLQFLLSSAKTRIPTKSYVKVSHRLIHGQKLVSFVLMSDANDTIIDAVFSALEENKVETRFMWDTSVSVIRDNNNKLIKFAEAGESDAIQETYIYMLCSLSDDMVDKIAAIFKERLEVINAIGLSHTDLKEKVLETASVIEKHSGQYAEFLRYASRDLRIIGYRETREDAEDIQIGILNMPNKILDRYNAHKATNSDNALCMYAGCNSPLNTSNAVLVIGCKDDVSEHICVISLTKAGRKELNEKVPLLKNRIQETISLLQSKYKSSDISVIEKFAIRILNHMPGYEILERTPKDLYQMVMHFIHENEDTYHDSINIKRDNLFNVAFITCCRARTLSFPENQDQVLNNMQAELIRHDLMPLHKPVICNVEQANKVIVSAVVKFNPQKYNKPESIKKGIRLSLMTWRESVSMLLAKTNFKSDIMEKFEISNKYGRNNKPADIAFDIRNISSMHAAKKNIYAVLQENKLNKHNVVVYSFDEPVKLSTLIFVLTNIGMEAISENTHVCKYLGGTVYIHRCAVMLNHKVDDVQLQKSYSAFSDVATLAIENKFRSDRLNGLALSCGFYTRQISILRTYALYLSQLKSSITYNAIVSTVVSYPDFAYAFINAFYRDFIETNPVANSNGSVEFESKGADPYEALDAFNDPDKWRKSSDFAVGQMMINLLQNTVRSNASLMHDFISIKVDTTKSEIHGKRAPYREIFVASHEFEGIHIRFGKFARGGIRWSDRSDFRKEVLGLATAQRVKNSLIIPDGCKGGFLIHAQIKNHATVENIYKKFITSLLDVTDNNGMPYCNGLIRSSDKDDNYLVVAADKGTSTFSDFANSVALSKQFWLGDAFASGSACGYDHKKMGITAKGAWECVKQHFFEMGINPEKDVITAVGIGDMSGDVFGNGMLLSKTIKLLGAYNGSHIFIDPDPSIGKSFHERKRLFDECKPWEYYDTSLISAGGGVFSTDSAAIKLTPELQSLLSSAKSQMSPSEIVSELLKLEVDLIWFGGIGTYIKASSEANSAVGDKGNDSIRVNANQIRAKVIGEGANLAITQKGRIELGSNSQVNTDFIDNAAGVNTSDNEVNIKIVLKSALDHNYITPKERVKILESMQDQVATIVTNSNRIQAVVISMMYSTTYNIEHIKSTIQALQKSGIIDIEADSLPSNRTLATRNALNEITLTRPEFCLLLSSSKLALYSHISDVKVPESLYKNQLLSYFPDELRNNQDYAKCILEHTLASRIVFKTITSEIINICGVLFPIRESIIFSINGSTFVNAYLLVREIFNIKNIFYIVGLGNHNLKWNYVMQILERISNFTSRNIMHSYSIVDSVDISNIIDRMKKCVNVILSDIDKSQCNKFKVITKLEQSNIDPKIVNHILSIYSLDSTHIMYMAYAIVSNDMQQHALSIAKIAKEVYTACQVYDMWSLLAEIGNSKLSYSDIRAVEIVNKNFVTIQEKIIDHIINKVNKYPGITSEEIVNAGIKISKIQMNPKTVSSVLIGINALSTVVDSWKE